MPVTQPATGFRYYSRIPKTAEQSPLVSYQYVYDPTGVWQQQDGTLVTGCMRPVLNTELGTVSTSQVSVSGITLQVGAVNITGFNSGSALGNLDVTRTYLPTSGVGTGQVNITNATLNVAVTGGSILTIVTGTVSSTISAVAVTGGTSGSAQGNLDLTRTYLPTSGVGTFNVLPLGGYVGITGTVNTSASVTVGAVAITGQNSGSALGNLDVTHVYLPVSGVGNFTTTPLNAVSTNVLPQGGFVGLTGAPVVTITGILATSTSVTVGNVAVTGGTVNVLDNSGWAFLASISGTLVSILADNIAITGTVFVTDIVAQQILSGISGQLVANLSGAAWVTGSVSGSNLGNLDVTRTFLPVSGAGGGFISITTGSLTATIAAGTMIAVTGGSIQTIVTGTVSANVPNPLGVTGTSVDRALPTVLTPPNFLAIGGRMVNPSGAGSITGYNSTGDMAMLNIASNGGVYVNQGVLDKTQDESTTWMASTGVGPVTSVSGLAPAFFGIALPNNPNRRAWSAVNIGTGGLMIKMSATIPTTGNLDIFLAGATTPWAGNGQSWLDSPAIYTGPVSVSGFGGAPCVYRMWEL